MESGRRRFTATSATAPCEEDPADDQGKVREVERVHELVEHRVSRLRQRDRRYGAEERPVGRIQEVLEPVRSCRRGRIHGERDFFEEGCQQERRIRVSQETRNDSQLGEPGRIARPRPFPRRAPRRQHQDEHDQDAVRGENVGPRGYRGGIDDRDERYEHEICGYGPVDSEHLSLSRLCGKADRIGSPASTVAARRPVPARQTESAAAFWCEVSFRLRGWARPIRPRHRYALRPAG